jgi:mono/diheme cytochrome c family protein
VRRLLIVVGSLCLIGLAGFLVLTSPITWRLTHPSRDVADASPANLVNGEAMFYAGSCGTCHASPGQKDETHLGGGLALTSGFGTFYMPNISPDKKDGIGNWTTAQFVRAARQGVSEHDENLYPAFPYTSYQRMTANDLRDLFGYINTLAPVAGVAPDHKLKFPFSMRRGVGVWRLVFLDGKTLPAEPTKSAAWTRGRYLVEGPGHCAECHSPRDVAGAVISAKRFAGAPDPEGHGYVPNITQDETGIAYWSQHEIADYLGTGISPIHLAAGGSMAPIIANLAHLTPADRAAMAEYIKSLAGIDAPNAGAPEPNRTKLVRMLPPATKAAQSPATTLSAPADALAKSTTVYTVAIKPMFLDRKGATPSGSGDGRLLPAAKLTVLAHDGDWLQVRIDGWQQKGSDAPIYALEGKRILMAALGQAAIGKVTRKPGVQDASTKLVWAETSLTAWVSKKDLSPDLAKIWSYTGDLYASSCGSCHSLHPSDAYLANQWVGSLGTMKRFTGLGDDQYRLLLAYLQFHAKDIKVAAAGAPAAGSKP